MQFRRYEIHSRDRTLMVIPWDRTLYAGDALEDTIPRLFEPERLPAPRGARPPARARRHADLPEPRQPAYRAVHQRNLELVHAHWGERPLPA